MQTLTYVSTAVNLFSKLQLETLLLESRTRNLRHNITGMLLYNRGTFMQTIEGEEDDIIQLYENICADQRHYGIIKLIHEKIPERSFPDWSMGFREGKSLLDGYTNFLNFDTDITEFISSENHGKRLLGSFKNQHL